MTTLTGEYLMEVGVPERIGEDGDDSVRGDKPSNVNYQSEVQDILKEYIY